MRAQRLNNLQGVPPELRDWVWMEVSGATRRQRAQHASYYAAMHRMARHESPFVHQIELVRGVQLRMEGRCRPGH